MTNAEIARAFVEKGWEIRYRGGNAICSTPSDLDVIVADAPDAGGGSPASPEIRPRYSIAAWPASAPGGAPRPPVFDLYDAERDVGVGVDRIPTPEEASRLLEQHEAERFLPGQGDGA